MFIKILIIASIVFLGIIVVLPSLYKKNVSLVEQSPGLLDTLLPTQSTNSPVTPLPIKPTVKPTPSNTSTGWKLTVYYTPVESYHSGEEENVPNIGNFSKKFLELVRLEGVGKISKGAHAGKYLHQTDEMGYWLTDAPLDALGKPLLKMKTMAAPPFVKFGTKVVIVSCGGISQTACAEISKGSWTVTDRFQYAPDEKHLDLYIGEEDRENFLSTHPLIFAEKDASVALY